MEMWIIFHGRGEYIMKFMDIKRICDTNGSPAMAEEWIEEHGQYESTEELGLAPINDDTGSHVENDRGSEATIGPRTGRLQQARHPPRELCRLCASLIFQVQIYLFDLF